MSIIKFHSKAAAEIIMLSEHAEVLLKIMGKSLGERGVIMPEEIAEARAKLIAAVNHDKMKHSGDLDIDGHDVTPKERDHLHDKVTLDQRAYPLLKMLEEAQKTNVDVHWGF